MAIDERIQPNRGRAPSIEPHPVEAASLMATATEADCRRALDPHSARLMALSGVQGVGIGQLDESGENCCIEVYLIGQPAVAIPSELPTTLADGRTVNVPVRWEVQGPLIPE